MFPDRYPVDMVMAASRHEAPDATPRAPFIPIVPAGGAGTRLWPLSRPDHPKFLLDLTGSGASLLQQTIARLDGVADYPACIITGRAHEGAVREQVGEQARVLVEPSGRNSMPAIALGAAVAEREHPDAIIGSFAADHLITDTAAFHDDVRRACAAAAHGYLTTLGIRPTHPATGFGYIRCQARDTDDALNVTGALRVDRFVEKPDADRAAQFLAEGGHLWNAGMFVARADMLLDALAEQIPPLAAGARRIAAALDGPHADAVRDEVWPTLTSIAIDHALAEPLAAQGRVAVVPATFDWDDVGDFAALARQLRSPDAGGAVRTVGDERSDVRVLGDTRVDAVSSQATVYGSSHRLVALVGVEGVSVVDTDDALLVLADEHAQALGPLARRLCDRAAGTASNG